MFSIIHLTEVVTIIKGGTVIDIFVKIFVFI